MTLKGFSLDGTQREVVLSNERSGVVVTLPAQALTSPPLDANTNIEFSLAGQTSTLPVGIYRIIARVVRPAESQLRTTNAVALAIAPRITNLPLTVARGSDGSASFTIEFTPALRDLQRAALVLGQNEHAPVGLSASPAGELSFVIPNAPVGSHLVRLRIDDIESGVVDRSTMPPRFLDTRVEIT